MGTIDGATLMAQSLKQQGVEYMFGIVGFPVFAIATAAQKQGIAYIGMRNEQSASYAAQAAGYLTGRPQACLVVSGPGVIHALAGLANARHNCWPMVLIGGASPSYQKGMGAFQEERQLELAAPYCKYAQAVERTARIPFYVEQAIRSSLFGRPGPAYLEMPDDVIQGKVDTSEISAAATVGDPPRSQANPGAVVAALDALESAQRPLVVIGKGMAWSRAETEVREFIQRTRLPFLASPMGKGILPDDDPLSVGAARSTALQEADLVFLMGARLNWIMHFGLPPRFAPDVRIIQLDVAAEEIGTNVPAEVALLGDGRCVTSQLNAALEGRQWFFPADAPWRETLRAKAALNQRAVASMAQDDSTPMNYYRAYRDIEQWLPPDAIIIGEGANTMDIGRTRMINRAPRQRLDAGTYGTMGVGLGFAIAAAMVHPGRPIVAVQGDSAFGFSGMELETACRYKLPIKVIVLNNGGIGPGLRARPGDATVQPAALSPDARYELMMDAFGGRGFGVAHARDLRPALDEAMAFAGPALVNVRIDPQATAKPQQFGWLTT